MNEELIDQEIKAVKSHLRILLEHKKEIMLEKQRSEGCTCGVVIIYFEASRLVNTYCKVHKGK